MKPSVKTIEDSETQTIKFRGYVTVYTDNVVDLVWCKEVWPNKAQAEKDAKKLMKKLKTA